MERLLARLTAPGQIVADVQWPGRKGLYLARTAELAALQ